MYSCEKLYTLYINLHILLNILCKATSNIQESTKLKIHCFLLAHELLSTKIYYTSSICTLYILFISRQIQKSKNPKIFKIQQVHQEIHTKQFLLFYLNCFPLATHLNLKRLEKRD